MTDGTVRIFRMGELAEIDRGNGIRSFPLASGEIGSENLLTGMTLFPVGGVIPLHTHSAEESVMILEGEAAPVLGPAPKLVAAMARHRLGQAAEAREALSQAGRSFDWTESAANYREAWMYHVLRREAEALVSQVPPVRPRRQADRDERG